MNKWVKVTVLNFEEKFIFCSKWGKWFIFGPKINTFELSYESVN